MIPMSAPSLDAAEAFPPLGKKIKTLLVWPKIPNSFWAFNGMLELLPEKVVMPPLGLVTVAALCPPEWTLRLVDEAVEDLTDDDLRWADLVMVGGMEVQKAGMQEILAGFQERQILIKDLTRGLIDFPAILGGKEVFLCWESDEDDIEFWHDLEAGYGGREKLE